MWSRWSDGRIEIEASNSRTSKLKTVLLESSPEMFTL